MRNVPQSPHSTQRKNPNKAQVVHHNQSKTLKSHRTHDITTPVPHLGQNKTRTRKTRRCTSIFQDCAVEARLLGKSPPIPKPLVTAPNTIIMVEDISFRHTWRCKGQWAVIVVQGLPWAISPNQTRATSKLVKLQRTGRPTYQTRRTKKHQGHYTQSVCSASKSAPLRKPTLTPPTDWRGSPPPQVNIKNVPP